MGENLMTVLNLYASDAVHLATALARSTDLLREDAHLLRHEIIEYAGMQWIGVFQLKSLRKS